MFDLVTYIYIEAGNYLIYLDTENDNHVKNRIDGRKLIEANELINHP